MFFYLMVPLVSYWTLADTLSHHSFQQQTKFKTNQLEVSFLGASWCVLMLERMPVPPPVKTALLGSRIQHIVSRGTGSPNWTAQVVGALLCAPRRRQVLFRIRAHPGGGFDPRSGCIEEATNWYFSLTSVLV